MCHMKLVTKIKLLLNTKDKKVVANNLISLSLLQGSNYILPLLTLPYLIRIIGTEYFGLLSFATATVNYFGVLTDYGFNLSATRAVSINRNNKDKLIEIFSSVMIIKIVFLALSFVLLSILIFTLDRFNKYWIIYYFTFGTIIGQSLFPVWFFQGMERMKYITYLNIIAKSIFTAAVFIFVRIKNDFYLVPILTSIGYILAGIMSLWVIGNKFKVVFKFQSMNNLKYYLKDGWHMFVATSFSSLYRESNTFILGLFASETTVGYFAISEKIVKSIQSIQTPIGQALFPFLSNKEDDKILDNVILKYAHLVFIFYLMSWFALLACSKLILGGISGTVNTNVLTDIRVLSLIIFLGGLSYYLGVLGLLTMGRSKEFSRSVAIAGVLNIVLCIPLSFYLADFGSVISIVLSETALLYFIVRSIWCIHKKRGDLALV